MGLFGEILGAVALSALDSALTPKQKFNFDVCFESEDSKKIFFTLLDKWNDIFQRKNILIDPKIEKISIDDKFQSLPPISTVGVAKRWWEGQNKHIEKSYPLKDWIENGIHGWTEKNSYWNTKNNFLYKKEDFPGEGELYTSDGKSIIGFHPNNVKEPCWINADTTFMRLPTWAKKNNPDDYSINLISYTPYGVWFSPSEGTELGFIFKISMINHFPDGILYMYFKNSESIIDSSAIISVVGPYNLQPHMTYDNEKLPWNNEKSKYTESELGLEHLLTILNRHDVYEHLQEFLKQPYSLSENRQKELAEQKRIETKKAALLEKMKHEKEEIIKKQEKIEQQQREEAERQAKLEAEKKQNDAINALNDL